MNEDDYEDDYEDDDSRPGTSTCSGYCDPMCDWCLVSHCCPDECGGGDDCPYVLLAARERLDTALIAGQ